MTKRFAVFMILLAMLISPAYSEDDDSTPYMPYPEQTQTQTPKPAPKKKAPAKKATTTKKKTPAKKTAPKKTTKPTSAKPSSLQQAITLINQGRYNEAKPYLLSAINANKNDANVWYWYGVWHEKLGCFHEAQYFYTKALKINPSFEPLSRVAYYPNDPDKIPLWDPKRPARVYPVEVEAGKDFTTVPTFARDRTNFPEAPNDPVIPKVPAYTPPAPGSSPLEGDEWSPAVYVPPSPNNPYAAEDASAVYVPPQGPLEAERRESIEIDIVRRESNPSEMLYYDRDRIIRADLPLYTPPAPGQKVTPPPAQKVTEQPKKASTPSQPKKQPAVPRKVVRQQKSTSSKTSQPKTQTQTKTQTVRRNQNTQPQRQSTAPRTASQDVRPVQTQPARPSQPQTQRQTPQQPVRQQEAPQVQIPERQPEVQRQTQRQEFMPPVGQYTPDPGTVSETPIPPVGQGNQY